MYCTFVVRQKVAQVPEKGSEKVRGKNPTLPSLAVPAVQWKVRGGSPELRPKAREKISSASLGAGGLVALWIRLGF